jgi:hypothetical protein
MLLLFCFHLLTAFLAGCFVSRITGEWCCWESLEYSGTSLMGIVKCHLSGGNEENKGKRYCFGAYEHTLAQFLLIMCLER